MSPRTLLLPLLAGLAAAPASAVAGAEGGASPTPAAAEPRVDFGKEILPILARACTTCHGPKKSSGGLRLDSGGRVLAGSISGKAVTPGKADASYLVQRLLGKGDEDRMPLKGDPLPEREMTLIRRWIDQGAAVPADEPVAFKPAPGGMKRLTVAQYRNTIRDLFGETLKLSEELEPDTLISGSAVVGAARIVISQRATEKFARVAFDLGRQALGNEAFRGRFLACESPLEAAWSEAAEACARGYVERFGRRAWRRPLTPPEIARYVGLGRAAARRHGSLGGGLAALTAALLQSPHFLYRIEVGVPDREDPSRRVLTDWEMASRLSYFLWSAPPDEPLLDAAAAGKLSSEEGLRQEAERMLRAPQARDTMEAFFAELFRLQKLEGLAQMRSKYRRMTESLTAAMREETLKVIDEVVFAPGRDFREIFDARFTYVNGELARLYGLPAPADEKTFTRISLPAGSSRAGVLGQASFLALNAHGAAPSPTKRGKFIREALLCQPVPPPPPNVNTKLLRESDGKLKGTTRQKLAAHRTNPRCAGCHKAMDPVGLAFETFDAIGASRDKDNGLPIDPSGELDGRAFKDAGELGHLLRQSPRVGVCVARSLYRFALGHLESEGEEPLLEDLARGLEREGYNFPALVLSVVRSRGFRYLSPPE
jgi:hypothetical protein